MNHETLNLFKIKCFFRRWCERSAILGIMIVINFSWNEIKDSPMNFVRVKSNSVYCHRYDTRALSWEPELLP